MVRFVVLILLVQGVPVLIATGWTATRSPVCVRSTTRTVCESRCTPRPGCRLAVTAVTVGVGQMSTDNASVLVAGGAITVLLLPLTSRLLARPAPSSNARV
jgi:hypothetical protein